MTFYLAPRNLLDMSHLRYRGLWLGLGFLLLAAIVVLSVINVPTVAKHVMLHDKLVHTAVYALLMGWFCQLFRHDLTRLLLLFGFVVLGVGMEFVQGTMTVTRQFELLDMLANSCGVVLAWALAYTWVGDLLPRFEALIGLRPTER